jgi:preprotein translocase subunit SecE
VLRVLAFVGKQSLKPISSPPEEFPLVGFAYFAHCGLFVMASTDVQTVGKAADRIKMGVSALLLLGGFVAYYVLATRDGWVRWAALLVCIAAAVAVFLLADSGKAFVGYVRESVREAKKVVWPTRNESIQMTLYVFGFVFLMALFLWVTDKALEWVLYDLLLGWK